MDVRTSAYRRAGQSAEGGLRCNDLDRRSSQPAQQFQLLDDLYNSVWELGARSALTACFNAHSQEDLWQISPNGAYIENQWPEVTVLGSSASLYKLSFNTMIKRGGVQWSVAATPGLLVGINFPLTSKLSPELTFVNANKTLLPPNTIVMSYGYGQINQTTVTTYILATYPVPFAVQENHWYQIESDLSVAGYVSASIDGTAILNASLADFAWAGIPASARGSWGFGAGQDQAAYVSNVSATSQNGTMLYHNDMTSSATLGEYGVQSNPTASRLDGAKRDRLIWIGDFYHTSRVIPASTGRWDHFNGTLQTFAIFQQSNGFMDIAPPMGYDLQYAKYFANAFLADYEILGFLAYYNYYLLTGDIATVTSLGPAYRRQMDHLLTMIDTTTCLSSVSGFNGPALGSATSAMMVQALNGAAQIAGDLGYKNATTYTTVAASISKAINKHLWNETLGVYTLSTSAMSDYSVSGISFVITAGVAIPDRAQRSLAALSKGLALGPGYKDNTQLSAAHSSDGVNAISPNTNGFLLSAALLSNNTAIVKNLLDNLWGAAMVQNNLYASGASWEYVNHDDLSPGLGLFTSLAHPWGGAPTYVLPEYIVGIRPVTAGYRTWSIIPTATGLNLTYAQASIKTPYGQLAAKWHINKKGKLVIKVSAPVGTSGSLSLPGQQSIGKVAINGAAAQEAGTILALGSGDHEIEVDV